MTLVADPVASDPVLRTTLPVVIIGAGPVGLAAAAQLLERGIEPLVLEQGQRSGAAVTSWGHIRLFSPWKHLVDAASVRRLEATGWTVPSADAAPTGHEFVADYVAPLARTLDDFVHYGVRVDGVSRSGMGRTQTIGRADVPFVLRLENGDDIEARSVIDASGTLDGPNSVIASGFAIRDTDAVASHLTNGLPDVLGVDRERFAGKHTVVVGAGHSAANTLIALTRLAKDAPGTTVTWVIRSASPTRVFGADADELPGRASLGTSTRRLVASGRVSLVDRFEVTDVVPTVDARVSILGRRGRRQVSIEADMVVVATGFRPNVNLLREVRVSLDEVVEAPIKLAPLIDPNLHSCGSVPPHGVDELAHPEPDFWIAGMKSYGRAPTFLLLTGYEQVRSIADELAGNREAARRIELVLPETGVCSTPNSTPGLNLLNESSCCQ